MNEFIVSLEADREKTKKMFEEERRKTNEMYQNERNETKNLVNSLLKKLEEERIESNKKHNEIVDLLKKNISAQNALSEKIDKLIGAQPKKENEK